MSDRTGCVSIDLDGLACYGQIHALRLGPRAGPDPLLTLALERFGELLAGLDLKGTAFAIGETLQDPEHGEAACAALRSLARAGHEIGNHSHSHDYRLSLRDPETIAREIAGGAEAIEAAVGVRPLGFRAPGYNLSAPLLRALTTSGACYDASVFPSAPYLLARTAMLGAMALAGRPSASHAGPPGALLAPRGPYRPHPRAFWRRGAGTLVELPITVLPGLGLPFIGTTVTALPTRLMRELFRLLRRRRFLSLELHGIDLLDRSDGLPAALAHRQPGLEIPAQTKLRRLRALLSLMKKDRPLSTLLEVARTVP